jgi:cytochrome P450
MEQSFFAFDTGSRTCIGKNILLVEMVKTVSQLLRKFEVTLTYWDRGWKTKNSWFVQKGQYVIFWRGINSRQTTMC